MVVDDGEFQDPSLCVMESSGFIAVPVICINLRTGVWPDLVTSNSAISACAKGEQWQLALVFLEDLTTADRISYNSAISACAAGSEWQKVFQLLERMTFANVLPDSVTPGP